MESKHGPKGSDVLFIPPPLRTRHGHASAMAVRATRWAMTSPCPVRKAGEAHCGALMEPIS